MLLLTLVAAAILVGRAYAFSFLAVAHRAETHVLVVEGWIHDFAIKGAVEEFHKFGYNKVLVTGGPVSGTGGYTNDFNTSASVGADRLKQAGLGDSVQMVPSRVVDQHRTYGSAIALRDWLRTNDVHPKAINVVTEAPHARRTRLLFQRALGDQIEVGIIPISNPDYDGNRWWRYSEGVKDVVTESASYLYARLLFSPD